MSKNIGSFLILASIILSACGGQGQQFPETPTIVPSTDMLPSSTPSATESPNVEDTLTPTATEAPPDNPTGCINKAVFVSDETIPDNTEIPVGTAFTKTWRIRNAGTCIWWSGYTLSHYSDESMSAPYSVPIPRTNPGETADISVDLIAPSVEGTYRGNFVIKNPAELIMAVDNDSRLWLIINVISAPTASPTTTSVSDGTTTNVETPCNLTEDRVKAESVVTALTTFRTQNGLSALPVNANLSHAAQAHANDMACNNLFVHEGSDGSTPDSRVNAAGYSASGVSENIYGSKPSLDGQGVIYWWATDQTDENHRRNLLTTKYTEIGVGYAYYENFGYYVLVFAFP